MTTVSETLNTAADLIEKRGWTQGSRAWGRDAKSGLCLEGGIMAAAGLTSLYAAGRGLYEGCPAFEAVANYLGCDPRPMPGSLAPLVWHWNDARNRTAAEVIEVLRAAALVESARENENAAAEVTA